MQLMDNGKIVENHPTLMPTMTKSLKGVTVGGSSAAVEGELLLGQSFIGRFSSWSIDNAKESLVLRW
jgi:hypothetical protein